jgi:hypothetical protein
MNSKICTVCRAEKLVTAFSWESFHKRFRSECKECKKKADRIRILENPEKRAAVQKKYREKNRAYFVQYAKDYAKLPKFEEKRKKIEENRQRREIAKQARKREELANRKTSIIWREWLKDPEFRKYADQCRAQKKRRENPAFTISCRIRSQLWKFLKGERRSKSTEELIGCSFEQFKSHLESQFTKKMSWENYGTFWHIDHIVPRSYFGTSEKELLACWNFNNLRPLEAKKNVRRQDKVGHVTQMFRF